MEAETALALLQTAALLVLILRGLHALWALRAPV